MNINFVLLNASWSKYLISICKSYVVHNICTTVRNGTCGITLGVHVCLRISEVEITNYLSIIFQKLYYYIIHYYFIVDYMKNYIYYIHIYRYIYNYFYVFIVFLSNHFPKIQLSVMAMVVTKMPFDRPIS